VWKGIGEKKETKDKSSGKGHETSTQKEGEKKASRTTESRKRRETATVHWVSNHENRSEGESVPATETPASSWNEPSIHDGELHKWFCRGRKRRAD